MKATIILLLHIVMLSGCASLKYETADGTKVTYYRLFTTSDSIEAQVGNAKMKAGGQKIDLSTLQALLNLLAGVK